MNKYVNQLITLLQIIIILEFTRRVTQYMFYKSNANFKTLNRYSSQTTGRSTKWFSVLRIAHKGLSYGVSIFVAPPLAAKL
jgi:hypothetical protein